MKTFWLKEIVLNKLFLPSGAPVPFESVDGTYGILETEDPYIASELAKAVRNHVGGVMSLTEDQFSEWKKKTSLVGIATFLAARQGESGADSAGGVAEAPKPRTGCCGRWR